MVRTRSPQLLPRFNTLLSPIVQNEEQEGFTGSSIADLNDINQSSNYEGNAFTEEIHSSKLKTSLCPITETWSDVETINSRRRLLRWQRIEIVVYEDSSHEFPVIPEKGDNRIVQGDSGELFDQLLQCIRWDDCKSVRSLLKKESMDVNVALAEKGSLLHEAAFKGCTKCIKFLLKSGSYVNICDDMGFTPLHAAVLGRRHEAVRLLLHNNALPNQVNFVGMSPCHLAVLSDDIYLIHELMKENGDPLSGGSASPFQMSIDLDKMKAFEYFVNMPALLNI